jgi:hypothetical protein
MVLVTLTLLVHALVTGDLNRAMVAMMSASPGTRAAPAAGTSAAAMRTAPTAGDPAR